MTYLGYATKHIPTNTIFLTLMSQGFGQVYLCYGDFYCHRCLKKYDLIQKWPKVTHLTSFSLNKLHTHTICTKISLHNNKLNFTSIFCMIWKPCWDYVNSQIYRFFAEIIILYFYSKPKWNCFCSLARWNWIKKEIKSFSRDIEPDFSINFTQSISPDLPSVHFFPDLKKVFLVND